jgi:hypothetical protein
VLEAKRYFHASQLVMSELRLPLLSKVSHTVLWWVPYDWDLACEALMERVRHAESVNGQEMLELNSKIDLDNLIAQGIPESLTLDYKASPALSKVGNKADELCKDVSAFANSAGGQIVYGIVEKNQVPLNIDSGSDKTVITPEWIGQIISSRIQPRIQNIRIKMIPIQGNQVAYVLSIPQATSFAPHQAPDKKYYRRFEYESVPMADYEVRDALKRATTPALTLDPNFQGGAKCVHLHAQSHDQNKSQSLTILFDLFNESPQPAEHTIVTLYVHSVLGANAYGSFNIRPGTVSSPSGAQCDVFTQVVTIAQGNLPVFKEAAYRMHGGISFQLASTLYLTTVPAPLSFGYRIQSPGFDLVKWGYLHVMNQNLEIEFT